MDGYKPGLSSSRKSLAVMTVVLLMAVTLAPLAFNISGGDSTENSTVVIYHSYYQKPDLGNGNYITGLDGDSYITSYIEYNKDNASVDGHEHTQEMKYYGNVWSTEYNPQLWSTGPGNIDQNWYDIVKYSSGAVKIGSSYYEAGRTLVFTGWKAAVYENGSLTGVSDVTYYPGEVIPKTVQENATYGGKIHVYAAWDYLNYTDAEDVHRYTIDGKPNDAVGNSLIGVNGSVTVSESETVSTMFTNIVSSFKDYIGTGNCTIDPLIKDGASKEYNLGSNYVFLTGDLVIQNAVLRGQLSGSNHGGDPRGGLFACGHVLILGLGITDAGVTGVKQHMQIFGGYNGGYNQIFNNIKHSSFGGEVDSVASMIIIHSGFYSNVTGGNLGGTVHGSTYISVRGASILDSLTGGCSGSSGSIEGYAFVYATNMNMPGDTYEEKNLGTYMGNFNGISAKHVVSEESTILTGASTNGTIAKDTYVYISGTTAVWDVQAAGRSGNSAVGGTAHLDVSGKAVVKHAACGSITDGISNSVPSGEGLNYYENKKCVKATDISIHDDAKVASVFGAGYDTFYKATFVSMYGDGSSIDLTIDGGTVGYVYGGGYRGTVGTADDPLDYVKICISGGRILGDIFMGGRGGLDKVCHDSKGNVSWGVSDFDSTGYSQIYAKTMTLNITGGTVDGNVYGGGESVPVISKYDGVSNFKHGTLGAPNSFSEGLGVASIVTTDMNISISGAVIKGDLYGAGKGVDVNAIDSAGRHESAYMFTMNGDGNIVKIPWISGTSKGTDIVSSDAYQYYASVIVSDSMNVTVTDSDIGYYRNGNIYGGGALGLLDVKGTYVLEISDTDTVGSVFGGGKGSESNIDIAAVTTDKFTFAVSGNLTNIGGSVYGGGELSKFTSANPVEVKILNSIVKGSVYGGGKGLDTTGKESWALFKAPSLSVSVSGANINKSVYGGGALGIVECDAISVSVLSISNVNGSVYGGGKGSETNISSAGISGADSVSVSVADSEVLDSVYGGGEMSSVTANSVCVSVAEGSVVEGSVFGGGKGLSDTDKTDWALLKSDTTVRINGSAVEGSVYGGGRLSRTEGTINIEIVASTVRGSVFGGGLGSVNTISTVGLRTTAISKSTVKGSVLGSSSLGNDNGGDSAVIVDNTEIGASIYGGGFKGELTGNTSVSVKDNVKVKFSIYGGADIGDVTGTTLDAVLVHGHSNITISGSGISVGRSIFGSGNSCKVYKEGESNTIRIEGLGSDSTLTMESVQSADTVDIVSSKIILTGRSDASMSQASTKFSLNHIKFLRLYENTYLDLRASIGDLKEYGSYAGEGVESTEENPSNTIVLNNGIIFSVMGEDGVYGLVHGYTYLSKNSSDVYGSYAYGSINTDDNSGFCIHSNGKYTKLEPSVFTKQKCKCWFLKGTLTYDITAVASHGKTSTTVTSVIPVSYTSTGDNKESYVIFTGATPVVLRNGSMNLVDGDCTDGTFSNISGLDSDSFGLFVGTKFKGDDKSTMTFNGGNGINAIKSPGSSGYDGFIGERNGMPIVSFTLFFNENQEYTGYVGYVLLHFIEATKTDNGEYQTYNDIIIRLAIHTEGDTESFSNGAEYNLNVDLNKGDGQQVFSIPRSFKDYTLWYMGSIVAETSAFDKMYLQTVANEGNTFGWNNPMGSPVSAALLNSGSAIDSLKGTHAAALQFSFVECDIQSAAIVKMNFVLKPDTAGVDIEFSITITVSPVKSHNVTFHSPEYNGNDVTISVTDGNTIHSTLIPVTGSHFIGWFTDEAHTVRFDFGTPVTGDLDLYADYKYTVRFIHGNGIISTYYVDIKSGGSMVYKPDDPVRYGYEFANWVCGDKTCFANVSYETITGDTDFVAVWKGATVNVEFVIDNLTADQTEELKAKGFVSSLTYEFGSTYKTGYYMNGDKRVDVDFEKNTAILKKYLSENTPYKFIRWGLYNSEGNAQDSYVYSDMYIVSTSGHVLKAQVDKTAILMVLDSNKPSDLVYKGSSYPDPYINAPVKSLLYGVDNKYTLSPNSGSLEGFELRGWSYGTDGFILNGSSVQFTLEGNVIKDPSGNTVSYTVCDDGSEFDGAYCVVLKAVWKQIDYTLTIEEPLGDAKIEVVEVKNHKGSGIVFNSNALHYMDVVTLRYVNGTTYSFSEWSCTGDYTVISEDKDNMKITIRINGFCTVAVRQGGMYSVDITLNINEKLSTEYELALNSGSEMMSLRIIGDCYSHSLIPSGKYSLMINYGKVWYAVSTLEIYGPLKTTVSLRTISMTVNEGYADYVSCPPLAEVDSTVKVSLKEGYEVKDSKNVLDENLSFTIVSGSEAKNLDLTVAKIRYTISISNRNESGCSVTVTINGNEAVPDSKSDSVTKYSAEYGSAVQVEFLSSDWHIFKWLVNGREYASNTDCIDFADIKENKDIIVILKSYGESVPIEDLGTYTIIKSDRDGESYDDGRFVYSLIKADSVSSIVNPNFGLISFAVSENSIELVCPSGPISGLISVTLFCNNNLAKITLNIIIVKGAASAGENIFVY